MNTVAGYNWQFVSIEAFALCIWVYALFREKKGTDEWLHTLGQIFVCLGMGIRIGFWALASRLDGQDPCGAYPNWACDNRENLVWAIQFCTVGVLLMTRPFFIYTLGLGAHTWWIPILVVAIAGFVFGAFF